MDLDLSDSHIDLKVYTPGELEEIFEDPFSIRLVPDADREDGANRYYILGRTIGDRFLFLCFWTDGKKNRIIAARDMSEEEQRFYQRSYGEFQ